MKCQKALWKGSGLGGWRGGLEKWENGSSGNSEEMRANRSYVSMETVTIIEISIPGWGCGLKQVTVENNSMSGEPDRITKKPRWSFKTELILGNSRVAHRGFKLMWFLYLNAYFEHPPVLPGTEINRLKQRSVPRWWLCSLQRGGGIGLWGDNFPPLLPEVL